MRIRDLLLILLVLLGVISPLASSQAQEVPPDPRFGIVEAHWDTAAAVEAGAAWERVLFQWSQLQPNSPDDWNTLHVPDEWLQWAQAQGREVVGLLKNTPHWATDADPPMEASVPRGLDLPIDDPGNTWAVFLRRVVGFYAPRGVHRWIIWNEPDISPGVYGQEWAGSVEEYYRLLKVAYLVIKEVDPEARVHLAGLTFWHNKSWLRSFLAVATADPDGAAYGYFFDVVSLHIYFQTDTVDYIVNEARAALSAYGLSKPVWINETNASPDTDPDWPVVRPRWRVDLREQASFILQAYALGLVAGAERIGVYKLIDAGLSPSGEPFGLLRPDHSRRPAYTAYQLATRYYAGTRSATLTRQPTWAQVTLNQGERTVRVLWARTQSDVSLAVPALDAQATLVDQEGNVQTLDGSGGSYALTLPAARCADPADGCIIGGPTFLLIEGGAGDPVAVPEAATATPDVAASPTPTVTATLTATLRPTSPAITLPPTVTPSATPSITPSPRPTDTPTATPRPTRTPTLTPSPTPDPTATASPTLLPEPTATVLRTEPQDEATPAPPVADRRAIPGAAIGLTVAALGGLSGVAVWYRGKRKAKRKGR